MPQTLLSHLTASWVHTEVKPWVCGTCWHVHIWDALAWMIFTSIENESRLPDNPHPCLPATSIHDNPRCGRACNWCKTMSILFSLATLKPWMNIALVGRGYCGIHTGREGCVVYIPYSGYNLARRAPCYWGCQQMGANGRLRKHGGEKQDTTHSGETSD